MRSFYEIYIDIKNLPQSGENLSNEISPQVGENLELNIFFIPWGHNKLIIDKCKNNQKMALFYVQKVLENNWSKNVLLNFLDTNLYEREGKAIANFNRDDKKVYDFNLKYKAFLGIAWVFIKI